MNAGLPKRLRDPLVWTHGLQLVKTTLAVVVAWLLAARVFDVSQPFLAPWAALLTVHATVFGSLKRGTQQVGAAVLGVLLAFAAGRLFGVGAVSIGLAVLLGLLAGSVRGLRSETTTAAATALVVLTTGYSDNGDMLVDRLFDTAVGIAVGLLVNLLVWPPLRDRAAAHHIDAIDDGIGALLERMAADVRRGATSEDVDAWVECIDGLDGDVRQAWRVLGQAHESGRLNPRPATRRRMRAADDFDASSAAPARGRGDAQHDQHRSRGAHAAGGVAARLPRDLARRSSATAAPRSARPTVARCSASVPTSTRAPPVWTSTRCPTRSGRWPVRCS